MEPLIIRDATPPGRALLRFVSKFLLIIVGAYLYSECRIRVGWDPARYRWSLESAAGVALVALAVYLMVFLVQRVLHPASISVGPAGVVVRAWFRARRFRWKDIRWFSVEAGSKRWDITKPGYHDVYVTLNDSGRGPWDPESIRLPRFDGYSPEELAALLTEQQRIHAASDRTG